MPVIYKYNFLYCPPGFVICFISPHYFFLFRVAIVSSSDPVCVAAKKMQELRVNSVVMVTGNKIQGILT